MGMRPKLLVSAHPDLPSGRPVLLDGREFLAPRTQVAPVGDRGPYLIRRRAQDDRADGGVSAREAAPDDLYEHDEAEEDQQDEVR